MNLPTPLSLTEDQKRTLGAYYTPDRATELMTSWVLEHRPNVILEPSFGDGAFLLAIENAVKRRKSKPTLIGAELLPAAFATAHERLGLTLRGHAGDFLATEPEPVDAVIGNPPFVRLRHLPTKQRATALSAARKVLGHEMDPSGSTWMPFILHSASFLKPGGSMALVLPNEITYVKYARPLWKFLGSSFGRLRVVRTYQRVFPDLLQDVVILLADNKGKSTPTVDFQVSQSLESLADETAVRRISVNELANGDRVFHRALLPRKVISLIDDKLLSITSPVEDIATIRIGYVSGDKTFFHPSDRDIQEFRLPSRSIRKSFGPGRSLRGHGLFASSLPETSTQSLWLPDSSSLTEGERAYVQHGESNDVHKGYKCSIRSPWYVVPGVAVPDAVFAVFNDQPLLLVNDDQMVASNSLLCAAMKPGQSVERLVGGWYNSLTQLSVEMEIHSLGGGVLVAVPLELSKVRMPCAPRVTKKHIKEINAALKRDDFIGACKIGDQALVDAGQITETELRVVREGIHVLKQWRTRPPK